MVTIMYGGPITETCRNYLYGAEVENCIDSGELTFRKKTKLGAIEHGQMAELSMFNYAIKRKTGKENGNTDYVSRYPVEESRGSDKDDVLPIQCNTSTNRIGVVGFSGESSKNRIY